MRYRGQATRTRLPRGLILGALFVLTTINLTLSNVPITGTNALLTEAQPAEGNSFSTAYWDTLIPAADSFVKENSPSQNRGNLQTLQVQSNSQPANFRTFARFDVSSIAPGDEVLKAEITLCASVVPGATRTYEVFRVTEPWVEGTITWSNQPGVVGTATNTATTPASPACMTWSVASDIQAWVAGAANNGFRINDLVENSATNYNSTFRSREYTAVPADRPSLFVVFRPCLDATAPGAPSGLIATAGDSQVGLDWSDNAELDLAGYNVYRSTSQGGPYAQVNSALAVTSDYVDTDLTNGTTYYYVVTALDNCTNEGTNSNEDGATPQALPPSPPTNLVPTAGFQQVALDWDDNVEPDLAGYNVYRSITQGGPYTKANGSLLATSNYTDSGLTNGTTYYYVVTAENAGAQESGYSSEASATPVDAPPAPPTGLSATPASTQVALNWDGNTEPDLAGYNVYRSTTQAGPYTKINGALLPTSDYTDTGLANGVTYYYVVTAEDTGANESGYSSEVSATPDVLPPSPPTGLVATAWDSSVSLDWNDNTEPDLAGYNVYRSATQGGPYSKVNGALVATSVYTDAGLTGGVAYYYVVTAENTGGQESGSSNEDSAVPYSILVAVEDAYVRENRANNNYGNAITMDVRSNRNNRNHRSFVKFDVSSIPVGSTVNSATLTLCATQVPGVTRTYNAHLVTASWAEGTITWNSQPTVAGAVTDTADTPASPGCMTWTVTSDVQSWVDGTPNNGWRVSDSAEGSATMYVTKFRTRDDGTTPSEQPMLQIDFNVP